MSRKKCLLIWCVICMIINIFRKWDIKCIDWHRGMMVKIFMNVYCETCHLCYDIIFQISNHSNLWLITLISLALDESKWIKTEACLLAICCLCIKIWLKVRNFIILMSLEYVPQFIESLFNALSSLVLIFLLAFLSRLARHLLSVCCSFLRFYLSLCSFFKISWAVRDLSLFNSV
jgi:hypothetical protein